MSKVDEMMNKKVSRKKFLALLGGSILSLSFFTKGAMAKVFLRDEEDTYELKDLAKDEKVKIDVNDSSSGYLKEKLTAGEGIALDEVSNTLQIKNTGNVNTLTFEKVLSGKYVKIRYPMYADEKFFRVYRNDVRIYKDSGWKFNTPLVSQQTHGVGRVTDLIDGVEILSPTNGDLIRVEYDEFLVNMVPYLALYREDGIAVNKSNIANAIPGEHGGILDRIDHVNEHMYIAHFLGREEDFSIAYHYATHTFVTRYNMNETFPDGWRIEFYKAGGSGSKYRGPGYHDSIPGYGEAKHSMNSVIVPRFVSHVNKIPAKKVLEGKNKGVYLFRMRNIYTNEVTHFSTQKLKGRRYMYVNNGTPLGAFERMQLI